MKLNVIIEIKDSREMYVAGKNIYSPKCTEFTYVKSKYRLCASKNSLFPSQFRSPVSLRVSCGFRSNG